MYCVNCRSRRYCSEECMQSDRNNLHQHQRTCVDWQEDEFDFNIVMEHGRQVFTRKLVSSDELAIIAVLLIDREDSDLFHLEAEVSWDSDDEELLLLTLIRVENSDEEMHPRGPATMVGDSRLIRLDINFLDPFIPGEGTEYGVRSSFLAVPNCFWNYHRSWYCAPVFNDDEIISNLIRVFNA